jgi:hypothetical protein
MGVRKSWAVMIGLMVITMVTAVKLNSMVAVTVLIMMISMAVVVAVSAIHVMPIICFDGGGGGDED